MQGDVLTSDIALYYYMLGDDWEGDFTEIESRLDHIKNTTEGLTQDDWEQLYEVLVFTLHKCIPASFLQKIYKQSDLSRGKYAFVREWSLEHINYNSILLGKLYRRVLLTILWDEKMMEKQDVANKPSEIRRFGNRKDKEEGFVSDKEVLELREIYKAYVEKTNRRMYICSQIDKDLKRIQYKTYDEVKEDLPFDCEDTYRTGASFIHTVFYDLDVVLDAVENIKTERVLKLCIEGLGNYIKLLK